MPSLETYVEHAPEYAQGIVNQWGQMSHANIQWTPEFGAVLNLACSYQDAQKHREQYEFLETLGNLKGQLDKEMAAAKADEAHKRQAFAEAFKVAEEKPRGPGPAASGLR